MIELFEFIDNFPVESILIQFFKDGTPYSIFILLMWKLLKDSLKKNMIRLDKMEEHIIRNSNEITLIANRLSNVQHEYEIRRFEYAEKFVNKEELKNFRDNLFKRLDCIENSIKEIKEIKAG